MIITFDIDGVLADFSTPYAEALLKVAGDRFPKDWRTSPETFPPVWNWDTFYGYTPEEQGKAWNEHILTNPRFWFKLPPIGETKEAIRYLNALSKANHQIYFLTHRLGVGAKLQTEEWLYNLGMSYPTVLLARAESKAAILGALVAEFYIDDKLDTVESCVGVVKKLYLLDAPYNRSGRSGNYTVVKSARAALEDAGLWTKDTPTK